MAEPAPAATPDITPANKSYDLKIFQFNCNGILGKLDELIKWMLDNDIKIVALQETKLRKTKLPNIPKYTLIRHDCKRNSSSGVAFLIHEDIIFEAIEENQDEPLIENISIKVDDITLVNLYIPPNSSCPTGFIPKIEPYLPRSNGIITGDINAHNLLWNSSIEDTRGSNISDEIGDSSYGVLNDESPTRIPTNGQPTIPDITLASLSLLPYMNWKTLLDLTISRSPSHVLQI